MRAAAPARLSWKEERELEALTERIGALEAEQAELEVRLADPAAWSGGDGVEANARYARLRSEMEEALARWMELEERAGG